MEESRYIMRTEVLKKRGVLVEKTWDESKKMWHIAGPAILASVAQFSIGFVTVAFIGHLGDLQLAAVAIVQNVIEGFVYGVMKFFQSQGRVWVMTIISLVVLAIHVLLNWILVTKLGHGMAGAAIAANISWWLIIIAQMVYVVSGRFSESWTGFSFRAFKNLWGFIKLSLVSAVMLCLELWYFTTIVLMVGRLENPQVAVDSVSICMALQLWTLMVAIGFNAAVSVRVGNELGAGNSKAARFSMLVSITTSLLFGAIFASIILAARDHFPRVFTSKPEVIKETSKLEYFLAATILLNSIQSVLHGIAVGAGWQFLVAFINVVCYYIFGLPVGALLGYKFKLGVEGIWTGMLVGSVLQTVILLFIMFRANWQKEVLQAEERMVKWGGEPGSHQPPSGVIE